MAVQAHTRDPRRGRLPRAHASSRATNSTSISSPPSRTRARASTCGGWAPSSPRRGTSRRSAVSTSSRRSGRSAGRRGHRGSKSPSRPRRSRRRGFSACGGTDARTGRWPATWSTTSRRPPVGEALMVDPADPTRRKCFAEDTALRGAARAGVSRRPARLRPAADRGGPRNEQRNRSRRSTRRSRAS